MYQYRASAHIAVLTRDKNRTLATIFASARPMQLCGVCLSVRPSVAFKTSNHILKLVSPSDSHTILACP